MKIFVIGLLSLATVAYAQTTTTNCATGAPCTPTTQNAGDNTSNATATNTASTTSQAGNSSASNASGVNISPTNTTSTKVLTNQTTTGTISGGNTSSGATGNSSSNDNHSSVGNTSSSSGGNKINTGGNKISATTGNNTNTLRADGGQGGKSTAVASGGAGGSSTSAGGSSVAGGGSSTSAGGSSVAGGANVGIGGSTTTNVDNSRSTATFIPPVVPPTPASTIAVGDMVKETTACGPLQQVIKTPVFGTLVGLFHNKQIQQGYTYDLAPILDEQGNEVQYKYVRLTDGRNGSTIFGTQATIVWAVLGTANGKNLAAGGSSSSGAWGQAGAGSTASTQQIATNIQLRSCEVGVELVVPLPVVEAPPITLTTTPLIFSAPMNSPVVLAPKKPIKHHYKPKPCGCK